jgi:hypothetical protein
MSATWPNFFIVGAPRAGTTSLYSYLKQVPGICMSSVKEPHYFASSTRNISESEYLGFFGACGNAIAIGEASVGYLHRDYVPSRIHEKVPGARIIISLRDPVERTYSQYFEQVRRYGWDITFSEMIKRSDHVERSFYADPVQRYLDVFGLEQVKIIIFEEFVKNPREAVRELMAFLGVNGDPSTLDLTPLNTYTSPRMASTAKLLDNNRLRRLWRRIAPARLRNKLSRKYLYQTATKPPMEEENRRYLEEIFRPDVDRLERILGKELPWFHRKNVCS